MLELGAIVEAVSEIAETKLSEAAETVQADRILDAANESAFGKSELPEKEDFGQDTPAGDLPEQETAETNEAAEREARGETDSRPLIDRANENAFSRNEISEQIFYSTPKERLDHTPIKDGKWTGERGESTFIPDKEEVRQKLAEFGLQGIEYKNAVPDFSKCAFERIKIDSIDDDRYITFKKLDAACADKWNAESREGKNDWTPRDISNYRGENGYTWHEKNDMKTCELVPQEIHDACTHLGGVSELNHKPAKENGGINFDQD